MKAPEFWENFTNVVKLIITLIKNDPHLGTAKHVTLSGRKEQLVEQTFAVYHIA